jgi:hypothetical protein
MSEATKVSTALAQEQEVGEKRNTQRGCRASHARIFETLVGDIVFEDDLDQPAGRYGGLDPVEKAYEFLGGR